jgi:hypothetical protein
MGPENQANIFKQFGVFTQRMFSDVKIHELLKLFSPTNAHFIENMECYNLQLKRLCIRPYMFRSIWTILRELMVILAKVTLLQNYQQNTSLKVFIVGATCVSAIRSTSCKINQ